MVRNIKERREGSSENVPKEYCHMNVFKNLCCAYASFLQTESASHPTVLFVSRCQCREPLVSQWFASNAAMHPLPAEVIAWRYFLS
jgi:hypothetical protein